MKNIVLGICGSLIIVYTVLVAVNCSIIFCSRQEMELVLSQTLPSYLEKYHRQRVIETYWEEGTRLSDQEIEELLVRDLHKQLGDSNPCRILIKACDMEKGILSVSIDEELTLPGTGKKVLSCSRTVIADKSVGNQDTNQINPVTTPAPGVIISPGGEEISSGSLFGMNASRFYQQYGGDAVFLPEGEKDGWICFGVRGYTGGQYSTMYETIGWNMTFEDEKGRLLQNLCFKLGGDQLLLLAETKCDDYLYKIYGISLSSLRKLLYTSCLNAMDSGKCSLKLNACLVVLKNGIAGGEMSGDGKMIGTVYTTYQGIVGAAGWSSQTLAALKSYFNKDVKGLFFRLELKGDDGIEWLTGSGCYCYGSKVEIDAKCRENYLFMGWYKDKDNSLLLEEQTSAGFTITSDCCLYAVSRSNYHPVITASDQYYAADDVRQGILKEETILSKIYVEDKEDGVLSAGADGSVSITDWEKVMADTAVDEEGLALTIEAEDSDGNRTESQVNLYFVESRTRDDRQICGQIRFISRKYLNTLMENSIWMKNSTYRDLLLSVLD